MNNFDTTDDGLPTAAHRWEQQFMAGGRPQFPPAIKLKARIEQLELAIAGFPTYKAAGGWRREITWRRKQLETLGFKEESGVGNSEPAG